METNETEEQRLDRKVVENIVVENIEENLSLTIHNFELGEKKLASTAAKQVELVTQKMITDYLNTDSAKWKQMVVTGGTASGIGNINDFTSDNTGTTKITMDNVADARNRLDKRSVEGFGGAGGKYIGLIHPACAHTLEFDAVGNTEQGMMDLKAGAIGTKYGITFYEYPFAEVLKSKGKGNPGVYPTFIMGKDAFFCLNGNVKSGYVTGVDSANPAGLGLLKKMSVTFTYNCGIHDANRIVVILSQNETENRQVKGKESTCWEISRRIWEWCRRQVR